MPTSSARNVNSSAPSLMTASGKSLAELRFLHIDRHGAATVAVCFEESSYPVHDASSASFVQDRHNALNRAITICLLVSQANFSALIRLSHKPKGAACALKTFALRRLRFAPPENCWALSIRSGLRMPHTTSCNASSFCCCRLRVRRHPPHAIIQREATAMRTDIRQSQASHTQHRRDNPPQEVSALFSKRPAQCSDDRHLPWQPCHGPPESSQKYIHRACLHSSL